MASFGSKTSSIAVDWAHSARRATVLRPSVPLFWGPANGHGNSEFEKSTVPFDAWVKDEVKATTSVDLNAPLAGPRPTANGLAFNGAELLFPLGFVA